MKSKFMEEEIQACQSASAEIAKEWDELRADCDAYNDQYHGPARSYAAIGSEQLSEADRADLIRLGKEAPAVHAKLMAHQAALVKKSDEHVARQNRLIAAQDKYLDALKAEHDGQMTHQVNMLAGLLSLGMACGDLAGPEWKFAKSVVEDFRSSKDYASRKDHFATLQAVLANAEYPASDTTPQTPAVLAELDSREGEHQTAYFKANRAEIMAEYDKQQFNNDNQNNLKNNQ